MSSLAPPRETRGRGRAPPDRREPHLSSSMEPVRRLAAPMGRGPRRFASSHAFFVGLAVLTALLEAFHAPATAALAYLRPAILRGQGWRVLTGHLVHASPLHLLWNLGGLLIVWVAFGRLLGAGRW